jgi:PTS system nitrogen regulatory IIA component
MKLEDYIDEHLILVGLEPPDKNALLRQLAEAAAARLDRVDPQALLERLLAREQQSSTGIGNGVAVPHAVVDGLDRLVCLLAQIPAGIPFEAVDDQPVRFALLLLAPADAVGGHLKLLARTARLVRRASFVDELCAAPTAAAIAALVLAEDQRHES